MGAGKGKAGATAVENLLKSIVDSIPVGVAVISADMTILLLNRRMRRWFPRVHTSERPLCYQVFNEPPSEGICAYCPTIETLRDGRVHAATTETPSRKGVINYRITATPLRDKAGRVFAAIEMVEDVTRERRLEKTIRRERGTFLSILEKSPYGVVLIDRDGRYLYVNDAFTRITGYALPEVPSGEDWFLLAYPDPAYRKGAIRAWRDDIARKGVTKVFTVTCKGGGGKEIEFLPIRLDRERTIVILSDVTDRMRAEEVRERARSELEKMVEERTASLVRVNRELNEEVSARIAIEKELREREEWLRAIIEAFEGLIYICSRDYRIEFMNERLIRQTGKSGVGEKCFEVIHGRDSVCPWCVSERVLRGETVRWEVKSPKDDRWYYMVNTPIYHIDNTVSKYSSLIDITERKESEDEIRKLNRELSERVSELNRANRELEIVNYTLSHDVRSPVIGIEGLSRRLLEAHRKGGDERTVRSLEALHKSAVEMRELVEGLLSFYSVGRKGLRQLPLDMEELARESFEQAKLANEGRGFDFRLHPLPRALGDKTMVRQVLANILGNAVKYTRQREVAVIEVSGTAGPEMNTYSVRDNGVGFSMDKAGKMFDLFERLDESGEYEGIGLGLAIVKRVVERHGGRLWVESAAGEGSTFSFSLPAHCEAKRA